MDAIREGADVNETTENDYSLLMCAAQNGAVENVLCLLSAGADAMVESLGKTASELAREEDEGEIADIIDAYVHRVKRRTHKSIE
jgi:ankyrin repeat protein